MLRLAIGVVFAAHGFQALVAVLGWSPLPSVDVLGVAGSGSSSRLVLVDGLLQGVGGCLLVLGAFTSVVTVLLMLERLASLWTLHLANGFFLNWTLVPGVGHGIEYHLLAIGMLACLLLEGAGELSVDALRNRRAEVAALGRARLRARKIP